MMTAAFACFSVRSRLCALVKTPLVQVNKTVTRACGRAAGGWSSRWKGRGTAGESQGKQAGTETPRQFKSTIC